jgi:hypothetical protein
MTSTRTMGTSCRAAVALGLTLIAAANVVTAHSGPPYPIVSDQPAGPYQVSIWTDPDATDDGSPGGQFWVTIGMSDGGAVPADTQAVVTIDPARRSGPPQTGRASPVNADVSRQFVALVMDHEGRFTVKASISSTRGSGTVESFVDATYDLRPSPAMVAVYALPFVVIGLIWLKVMVRRRGGDGGHGTRSIRRHGGTERM